MSASAHRNSLAARIARLTRKELRETLRDRRTIITLVLMPLLVYPLLSIAFQRFVVITAPATSEPNFRLGFESEADARLFISYLSVGHEIARSADDPKWTERRPRRRRFTLPQMDMFVVDNVADSVAIRDVDVGVRIRNREAFDLPTPENSAIDADLMFDPQSTRSREALDLVERRLSLVNDEFMRLRLEQAGVKGRLQPVMSKRVDVEAESVSMSFPLATLVPFVLILTTITGAVYPAIDLTAGERERGTLEMLIAAPVPKIGLLFAKYVAVVTVAMLTAAVNCGAMTITVFSIGLTEQLFGERGLTFELAIEFVGLLLLFAAFFSAVLLALTSFARSFKEAQAYLVPLMLAATAPGIFTMINGVRLTPLLAVTPLANIVLLSRDMFEYNASPTLSLLVFGSTMLYAGLALFAASRLFGSDAVLYGSSEGTMSATPLRNDGRPAPSLAVALLTLVAISPLFVLLNGAISQLKSVAISGRIGLAALATLALFLAVPILVCRWARLKPREGLGLNGASPLAFVAAVLLGLSLWPFAHEIFVRQQVIGWTTLGADKLAHAKELVEQLQQMSPVWLVLCMAIVPALSEEVFFRGFLLSALRTRQPDRAAILLSAVIFGAFHVVVTDSLLLERFLPSTLLGIVLGWLAVRVGSIWPGVVLHATHNGLLLVLTHFQKQLEARGWGLEEAEYIPTGWLVAAATVSFVGILLALQARRPVPDNSQSASSDIPIQA